MTNHGQRLDASDYAHSKQIPLRVVLENIRSGQNVGAFFRTADAFRLAGIDLCGYTAHPPHRDILKSALGASDHLPWRAHEDALAAIDRLREEGYLIAAIEQHPKSTALQEWQPAPDERWALIFGNEVKGVEQATLETCDAIIEIPQFGVKRSLNVSVCAGIVMWHAAHEMGWPV